MSDSLRPVDCSTPGFPALRSLLEFAQTDVHWLCDAVLLSHPLMLASPLAFGLSQRRLPRVTPRGSPAPLTSALLSELSISPAAQESCFLSPRSLWSAGLPGTSSCPFSAVPCFRALFMTNSTPGALSVGPTGA